jgi:hypothetical protein
MLVHLPNLIADAWQGMPPIFMQLVLQNGSFFQQFLGLMHQQTPKQICELL